MATKTIIVGGGPAGFFAAIATAQANPNQSVTLLEASHQLLAKVKISGGGRCNVTHACFDPAQLVQSYPRGGKALRGAFSRFQPQDTVYWYEQRGVRLKTEADGRMFPITDQSQTIMDCLLTAAQHAGVQIKTGCAVQAIAPHPPTDFTLSLKTGGTLHCNQLLIATGSHPLGLRLAQQTGHPIQPPVPSLFTFAIKDDRLAELAGISVNPVRLTLPLPQETLTQTGPLLITHWGLSGPAVLKLSAWGARSLHACRYRALLKINWLPAQNQDELRAQLLDKKERHPKRAIAGDNPFPLPHRLWERLSQRAGITPDKRWADLAKLELNKLILELNQGQYQLQGKGVFKEEFVTCGGVDLKAINFKTMESKLTPGLYFAGEVLDIDGITGGFNFQSAWTTGWIAGQAIAQT
jgi:predicted Rossmann fold flavoprotein